MRRRFIHLIAGFHPLPRWLPVAILAALTGVASTRAESPPDREMFRVGFSTTLFSDVNENDARASVSAWAQAFASERGIAVDAEARILGGLSALQEALRTGEVDVISLLTEEFRVLQLETPLSPIYAALVNNRVYEEGLLLVHVESDIQQIEDLRGRTLAIHDNPRNSLSHIWLDTVLQEKGLPPAASLAGAITSSARLSGAVLPVFFRKTDACLVTRNAFETMAELNPQVGRMLRPVAASPGMLPVLMAFREDYRSPYREDIHAGMRDLHNSVAGRQVLTVFKSESLMEVPSSALQTALDLLDRADAARRHTPDRKE